MMLSQEEARNLYKLFRKEENQMIILGHVMNLCWIILAIIMLCFTQIRRPLRIWYTVTALQCLVKWVFDSIKPIAYLGGSRGTLALSVLSILKLIENSAWLLMFMKGIFSGFSDIFAPDVWWLVGVYIGWYVISPIMFWAIMIPIGGYLSKASESET